MIFSPDGDTLYVNAEDYKLWNRSAPLPHSSGVQLFWQHGRRQWADRFDFDDDADRAFPGRE